MKLSRRDVLSLSAVGTSVIAGGILLTDSAGPYRVAATVGTRPTRDSYLNSEPSVEEGGALWASILDPDDIKKKDLSVFPDHIQNRLVQTESDTFWVVAGAVLPPEIEFWLGQGQFGDGTLSYTVTPYEDRIDGAKGDLDLDLESTEQLMYHYKFQQWTEKVPWADPPEQVTVQWVSDPG